jgi:formate dehydrogenase maturation protein FdhE
MSDEKKSGDTINATIGNVSDRSQIAVGHHIEQSQVHGAPPVMTEAEMVQLRQMFEELKTKIAQEAPPAEKDKALERVDELQEAVTAREPDLTTMEYVRNWFVKNLPSVAGSVVSLIVHPLVGKLVEVGGEAISTTFRKRFGIEKN